MAAGREIVIDLNVAETAMLGRFGSAVGKRGTRDEGAVRVRGLELLRAWSRGYAGEWLRPLHHAAQPSA
jgi:hypothetical protein